MGHMVLHVMYLGLQALGIRAEFLGKRFLDILYP